MIRKRLDNLEYKYMLYNDENQCLRHIEYLTLQGWTLVEVKHLHKAHSATFSRSRG